MNKRKTFSASNFFKIYLHYIALSTQGKTYRTVLRSQTATEWKIVIIRIKLASIIMSVQLQNHIQALHDPMWPHRSLKKWDEIHKKKKKKHTTLEYLASERIK